MGEEPGRARRRARAVSGGGDRRAGAAEWRASASSTWDAGVRREHAGAGGGGAGAAGRVLGVDVSAPMLARAREQAAARGLGGAIA